MIDLRTPASQRFFADADLQNQLKRSCFDKDRDRIIHTTSFRRLAHKTQVVFDAQNDHVRNRLTHSIEVSQIARSIARYFKVSEPLTESIALAHDLGHPPFGHVGEEALKAASKTNGHNVFFHNDHTLRILTELESPYKIYQINGLNLTKACIESIALHNGPLSDEEKFRTELPNFHKWLEKHHKIDELRLDSYGSLESQIAGIADDIAYLSHDLDDALRLDFVKIDEAIAKNPILKSVWLTIQNDGRLHKETLKTNPEMERITLIRKLINKMVNDVIQEIENNLKNADIKSHEAILRHPSPLVDEANQERQNLKYYLSSNFWKSEKMEKLSVHHKTLIVELYGFFLANPNSFDNEKKQSEYAQPSKETVREQEIIDYIAGMTDRFALDTCKNFIEDIPSCKNALKGIFAHSQPQLLKTSTSKNS